LATHIVEGSLALIMRPNYTHFANPPPFFAWDKRHLAFHAKENCPHESEPLIGFTKIATPRQFAGIADAECSGALFRPISEPCAAMAVDQRSLTRA
jgi:hypothetical protein